MSGVIEACSGALPFFAPAGLFPDSSRISCSSSLKSTSRPFSKIIQQDTAYLFNFAGAADIFLVGARPGLPSSKRRK
jgi:hypothetical protein